MKIALSRIAEFISAAGDFSPAETAQGYSIDSRTVGPGQLFFAVKGERLDGHDFVEQALEKGAVAAVVRKDQLGRYPRQTRLLAVEDTLVALADSGHGGAEALGQAADRGDGIGGEDDYERSDRACAEHAVSGAEVGRELQ